MGAYVANPSDSTHPADTDYALVAAAELRALKAYIATLSGLNQNNFNFWAGGRNRIINGDMRVDQRNSGNAVANAPTGYYLDRWMLSTDTARFTVQRVTDAPPGFSHSLRVTNGAAGIVPAASGQYRITQSIEGLNAVDFQWGTANAQSVTVGFWAKHSLAGTYGVTVFPTLAPYNPSYVSTYTINTPNVWEYKTITIPGAITGTWPTDSSAHLALSFDLGSGANIQTATLNTWQSTLYLAPSVRANWIGTANATMQITGVQLEPGTVATPYERIDYSEQVRRCRRYARPFPVVMLGQAYTTTAAYFIHEIGNMRATPTLSTTSGFTAGLASGGNVSCTPSITSLTDAVIRVDVSNASGLVAGNATNLTAPTSAILSAEL